MWQVTRTSPEGYRSYKYFDTYAQAESWVNSEHAQEDKDYGYTFTITRQK